jgi:organic hydroperoxide reductase OsmC/OhrA
MSVDVKYRTSATAIGGREGTARSEDGRLEVQLATPKELGGPGGEGTNPEQLFAAGYSAGHDARRDLGDGLRSKRSCSRQDHDPPPATHAGG